MNAGERFFWKALLVIMLLWGFIVAHFTPEWFGPERKGYEIYEIIE